MPDDRRRGRLRTDAYANLAEQLRAMAERASPESRVEFARLGALYGRLAARTIAGDYGQPSPPPLEPYKGVMRLPLQETYFHFSRESVATHVPNASGVYALWSQDCWIYVGESIDLQHRLLAHLSDDNARIAREHPTTFGFELIEDPVERVARQAALIRDLMPIC